MKKKIVAVTLIILVVMLSIYCSREADGLKKYTFSDESYGKVSFSLPKGVENMSIEGIHLLMKQSEAEQIVGIPDIPMYMYSGNFFSYFSGNCTISGNYSNISKGEYIDSLGETKPDYLVNLITIHGTSDDVFFGIKLNRPFIEAEEILEEQGFEFVKGRAMDDPYFIFNEMYKKGDLYILLENNQGILRMMESVEFPEDKMNCVRGMRIEIRTGVDKVFVNEDYHHIEYLIDLEKSYPIIKDK